MSKLSRLTSRMLPSTTISGLALVSVDNDEAPRRRIVEPEPKSPLLPTMSRPAIRPCRASSTVVKAIPSTSFIEKLCVALDTSLCGMGSPLPVTRRLDFTVTSFSVVADSIFTLYVVLLMGRVCVFNPTKLKRILSFWFFTFMVKLPFRSVVVDSMIRPLPSISHTVAPISGPISSLIVPCTDVMFCAWTTVVANSASTIMIDFSVLIPLLPPYVFKLLAPGGHLLIEQWCVNLVYHGIRGHKYSGRIA